MKTLRLESTWLVCVAAIAVGACASPIQDVDSGPSDGLDHAAPTDANPCGQGTTQCGEICVATSVDPSNCGACGNVCSSGQFCVAGHCTVECGTGTVHCGTSCIDPMTNPAHCGASADCSGAHSGTACTASQTCVAGHCQTVCPTGQVLCGGNCVDPQSSRQFCGASGDCSAGHMGTTCTSTQSCVSGACQSLCGTGQIVCGGVCTNPQTNRGHCGASGDCTGANAGAMCQTGELCVGGTCQTSCPTGQVACGGTCISPNTDPTYCGATGDCTAANAGMTCATGQACMGGTCQTVCPTGQVLCGSTCVDPMTNPQYCGATMDCAAANAGMACAADQYCSAGTCTLRCLSGQLDCYGQCVDPMTSHLYCGAVGDCMGGNAGTPCGGWQTCSMGACVDLPRSYIEPYNGNAVLVSATQIRYTLTNDGGGTIIYTLDNSQPVEGMGTTMSVTSPITLPPLPDGTIIRWYADFGGLIGREPTDHGVLVRVDPTGQINSTLQVSQLSLNGLGPVIHAAPGATIMATANAQYWHANGSGYCPNCVVFVGLGFPATNTTLNCDVDYAGFGAPPFPGATVTWNSSFTAPTMAGRYYVRDELYLDSSCSSVPNGAEIGEVLVP